MSQIIAPIEGLNLSEDITQLFGVNRSVYKPKFGIVGHNGLDFIKQDAPNNGYGKEILASHDGKVWLLRQDVPHQTAGNGIYIISEDGKFATVYWHLSQFLVKVGQKVKQGDVIGLMGNSGFVMPQPTQGRPHAGTHSHWAKLIIGLRNDYNGFVDPLPDIYNGEKLPLFFVNDLYYLRGGAISNDIIRNQISWLQTVLKIEGFAKDYEPIGYFGWRTRRDVKLLQQHHKITPAFGYVGPKTRRFLNEKYSKYI